MKRYEDIKFKLNNREFEIIIAALEGDITYQRKQEDHLNKPAFRTWLEDTESLLKEVKEEFSRRKIRQQVQRKFNV